MAALAAAPSPSAKRARRTRLPLVAALATLVTLTGIGLWAWTVNTGPSDLEMRTQNQELQFRSDLQGFMEDNSMELSAKELETAVAFGRQAYDEFRAGLTYKKALEKYGPSGDAFPDGNKPTDAWIAQAADGITQIIVVGSVLALAAKDLCPEADVLKK